jgi:predicted ArsR family transcriptional regulator
MTIRDESGLPLHGRSDQPTSAAAAATSAVLRATQERRIIEALQDGDATKDELASRTGIDPVAVARRMARLCRIGWCKPSGVVRFSPRGRPQTVWTIDR